MELTIRFDILSIGWEIKKKGVYVNYFNLRWFFFYAHINVVYFGGKEGERVKGDWAVDRGLRTGLLLKSEFLVWDGDIIHAFIVQLFEVGMAKHLPSNIHKRIHVEI